ncbi:hypothetical protein ADUPG1_012905, partial [Aduncisulcus paluster]
MTLISASSNVNLYVKVGEKDLFVVKAKKSDDNANYIDVAVRAYYKLIGEEDVESSLVQLTLKSLTSLKEGEIFLLFDRGEANLEKIKKSRGLEVSINSEPSATSKNTIFGSPPQYFDGSSPSEKLFIRQASINRIILHLTDAQSPLDEYTCAVFFLYAPLSAPPSGILLKLIQRFSNAAISSSTYDTSSMQSGNTPLSASASFLHTIHPTHLRVIQLLLYWICAYPQDWKNHEMETVVIKFAKGVVAETVGEGVAVRMLLALDVARRRREEETRSIELIGGKSKLDESTLSSVPLFSLYDEYLKLCGISEPKTSTYLGSSRPLPTMSNIFMSHQHGYNSSLSYKGAIPNHDLFSRIPLLTMFIGPIPKHIHSSAYATLKKEALKDDTKGNPTPCLVISFPTPPPITIKLTSGPESSSTGATSPTSSSPASLSTSPRDSLLHTSPFL